MTEEEKLDAGLYYDFWDASVKGRKLRVCQEFCVNRFNKQHRIAA